MGIPEDFTIKCSNCGGIRTDTAPLSGGEWLVTCQDCFQQDVLTDEALAKARQGSQKTVTGQPLVSGKRSQKPNLRGISSPLIQKTNPVIRNAELRAGKTQVGNPLIRDAERRAKTQNTEVQNV